MVQMQSDEALITQALLGQQQAYAQLVERYQHYVFTLAVRMVKNREEAAEVAQDSFLRAFQYLADFRGEAKFSTWLYRIVHSVALNHLRKRRLDVCCLSTTRPIRCRCLLQPNPMRQTAWSYKNVAMPYTRPSSVFHPTTPK